MNPYAFMNWNNTIRPNEPLNLVWYDQKSDFRVTFQILKMLKNVENATIIRENLTYFGPVVFYSCSVSPTLGV